MSTFIEATLSITFYYYLPLDLTAKSRHLLQQKKAPHFPSQLAIKVKEHAVDV